MTRIDVTPHSTTATVRPRSKRRRSAAAVLIPAALFVAGCGSDGVDDASVASVASDASVAGVDGVTEDEALSAPSEVTVVVDGFMFGPSEVRVAAGGTVTWDFREPGHTVVIDEMTLSASGETSMTFDEPGIYEYRCGVHPSMRGTVTVV